MPSALLELPQDNLDDAPSEPITPPPLPLARRLINTSKNLFGLFRRYTQRLPTHDPEELLDLEALTEDSADRTTSEASNQTPPFNQNFYPFPNQSSFQLSEWYWSDGAQKSQSSFKKMVNIVTSPEFKPEDVKDTKWDKLNAILGQNDFDKVTTHQQESVLA